ncbi:MAG: PEP-CTERM sorting domain-containing protein [Pseudomonadota bacterium]
MKNFAFSGALGAAALAFSVPASAATTVFEGNQVECSTNTFAFSKCNGAQSAIEEIVEGGAPEFDIFAVNSSADPLIKVDFSNGFVTLEGFGDVPRLITGTTLSFANLTQEWGSATLMMGGNYGDTLSQDSVSIVDGVLKVNLIGSSWFEESRATIALTAVPEPGTWLMLVLGLFGIGGAMRQQRAKVSLSVSYA